MPSNKFKFKSKIWLSPGITIWHFVSLPKKQSQGIMRLYDGMTAGFGSLTVNAVIGKTKWKTSIFPNKKTGVYMLPLKKEVRIKENIQNGDIITYFITII